MHWLYNPLVETSGRRVDSAASDSAYTANPTISEVSGASSDAISGTLFLQSVNPNQWIIFDEFNIDDPTQSYDFEDGSVIGHFSKPFFHTVLNFLKQHVILIEQVPRR